MPREVGPIRATAVNADLRSSHEAFIDRAPPCPPSRVGKETLSLASIPPSLAHPQNAFQELGLVTVAKGGADRWLARVVPGSEPGAEFTEIATPNTRIPLGAPPPSGILYWGATHRCGARRERPARPAASVVPTRLGRRNSLRSAGGPLATALHRWFRCGGARPATPGHGSPASPCCVRRRRGRICRRAAGAPSSPRPHS